MNVEKIKNFFKKLFKKTDELLFPPYIRCLLCGRDLKQKQDFEFCDKCAKQFDFIDDKCCKVCGVKLKTQNICQNCSSKKREFDSARSVCVYGEASARLVKGFKYSNKPYIHRTLGYMMAEKFKTLGWNVDFAIPVPISPKRLKERGFNQTEMLLSRMTQFVDLKIEQNLLTKPKESQHQASLNFSERQENIKQSFVVTDKSKVKGKTILLIDDVLTTGATLGACAQVLKNAGALHIFALTFASTKPESDEKRQKTNKKFWQKWKKQK